CLNGIKVIGSDAAPQIRNNLLYAESLYPLSSAFVLENSSGLTINNNTIDGFNTAISALNSSVNFTQNIVWNIMPMQNPAASTGSTITMNYNNINAVDGTVTGIANINANPQFNSSDTADYTLSIFSPCIDAGDPGMPLDPDGSIADLGAYYYHHSASFSANPPLAVQYGQPVEFYSSTFGHDPYNAFYEWDFNGDGNIDSIAENPVFIYPVAGTFDISLKVTTAHFSDSFTILGYQVLSLPIPQNLVATAWDSSITLSWDALAKSAGIQVEPEKSTAISRSLPKAENPSLQLRTDTEAGGKNPVGIRIYRKTEAQDQYIYLSQVSASSISYTDQNLLPGLYSYYITSVSATDMSEPSNIAAATVHQTPAPYFDPPAASFGQSLAVTISCADPEALIYFTMDGSDPGPDSEIYTGAFVISATTRIKAVAKRDGYIISEITTADYYLLAPPHSLSASFTSLSVNLLWQEPSLDRIKHQTAKSRLRSKARDLALTGYNIYRDNLLLATVNPAITGYIDTMVESGITYQYHITAVYNLGESSASNSVLVTPLLNTASSPMESVPGSGIYQLSFDPFATGVPVNVWFETSYTLPATISLLYSTNPQILSGLSNPNAMGAYYLLESSVDEVFTGTVFFRIQLPNVPNDIFFRTLGNWQIINPALISQLPPPAPDYTFMFALNLPAKNRGSKIEFAADNGNETLPIHLSSFTAVLGANTQVLLQWVVESETDQAGYNVLRSQNLNLEEAIRLNHTIITEGTMNGSEITYRFQDHETEPNTVYYYWLESVELDGFSYFAGPLIVSIGDPHAPEIPEIPLVTALKHAFPNPFNPSTTLSYSLESAG
ncbi:MAG: FN3 associated domain-containing protein, partial [Candidatus Cloacimonadaceae bacterium]|nr:FN3 associated domain-containing protein [Candidatus Cloacimonadaceae bacterium]